jgi:glyoxylase-like metal-dependent hydrolase (beta-lactamase superfamily II)
MQFSFTSPYSSMCRVVALSRPYLVASQLGLLVALLGFSLSSARAENEWLHALNIAPGVYVLPGDGAAPNAHNLGRVGNLGFLVGKTGVIIIDTGSSAARAQELIHAIKIVTNKPLQYVLISHPAQEVLFGDGVFKDLGVPIWSQAQTPRLMAQRCDHCLETLTQVLGQARMSGTRLELPDAHTFPSGCFILAGRKISVVEGPQGTVPGNLVIRDEATGVVFSGALLSVGRVPAVQDTTPPAWERALTYLSNQDPYAVVPAYGPIALSPRAMQLKSRHKQNIFIKINEAISRLQGYLRDLDEQARGLYARRIPLEEVTQQRGLFPYADWDDYSLNHAHNLFYRYLQLESEDLLSN